MRSRWNLIIVLVYMGISLGVLSYMAVNMIGPCRPFAGCQSLNVEFKNASGLLHSNDLRVAGVKAGQVTQIRNQGGMAVVAIQVQRDFLPVYRDAHAIVRPKNLLGETYVEVDRGSPSAGEMREGDTIALDHTITPVQVDEVLNALDPDTRTKLQIVINSLGEATAARGKDLNLSTADLKRISADLAVTSTSLNQEKDNIDALLVQFDLIQQTAADDHAQLAQTLQDWNTVSATMQKKAATFADAITHLNHVLADLDTALSPNARPLQGAVAQLPTALNDAAFNTPGGQVCGPYGCSPGADPVNGAGNGGFLGISSSIQELFIKKPANCTAGPCGNTLQDGIALFPRLAQTMLGVQTCDYHIYANGYYNVPGITEPGSCGAVVNASGNPTNPNLNGEVFDSFDPSTSATPGSGEQPPPLAGNGHARPGQGIVWPDQPHNTAAIRPRLLPGQRRALGLRWESIPRGAECKLQPQRESPPAAAASSRTSGPTSWVVAVPSQRLVQNFIVILFFALLSVSGLLFMSVNTGQRFGPLPPQFILTFNVKDADGLVQGSEVRVAGVHVGIVNKITTISTGAQVELGIEPQYNTIYSDATVLIRPKSLLGEKYVDMTRGASNVSVPDGGTLPASQAFTQVELDRVLAVGRCRTRKAVSIDIQGLGQGPPGTAAPTSTPPSPS